MPGESPARANPLLAPVPCQWYADKVRIPDGTGGTAQRAVVSMVTPSTITTAMLDAADLDNLIELLTQMRGKMSGLITPGPGPVIPPGIGPPNGQH